MIGFQQVQTRHELPDVQGLFTLNAWHRKGVQPAIIFVHGLFDAGVIWRFVLDHLEIDNEILVVDLLGHGCSSSAPETIAYGANLLSRLLEAQLDKIEVNARILVGHSLGAEIAFELARINGSRICGIVSIDYNPLLDPEIRALLADMFASSRRVFASVSEYETYLFQNLPRVSNEAAQWLSRSMLKERNGTLELIGDPNVAGILSTDTSSRKIPETDTNVLIIRGERSSILSKADAEQLTRELKSGTLHQIEEAGHAVPLEQPCRLAHAITAFTDSLGEDCKSDR